MESEGQIRTRIIDRAVQMFSSNRSRAAVRQRALAPADDGLFTTMSSARSLKEEFGLAIDADTCVAHLSAMGGIERVGRTCVWRSVAHARCGLAAGGRS